ncbi:LysM peptidoglycan-binding domain-containing M23 family metallopeptidase [Aliirhizobium smilacinae]|uniref:LysM peptidoglycan-binding domain-containing M23 family metallopeptidase n=1 Tax=Aliirhizobium smilacinae TaxID=1395944 RepID=A0A5C4XR64_9HYPH|nr:LysM peptidoglycan-binding domain-containing M23 family metallopeptidase [Rhizobium smilacinae]TNM65020.1 LysM peptidoglycan-binding domain-containing M23 family metallopeptidase [Rhizobium smilacinae]
MRFKSSSKFGTSVVKFAAAALLASAATGCSSDATRFSGLFDGTDNMTTASIPQRQGGGAYGQAPVPRGDVSSSQGMQPQYGSNNVASAQPYPASGGYSSPARVASAPSSVQRSELSAPGELPPVSGSGQQMRQQAMAQPFPQQQSGNRPLAQAPARNADELTTGTVKPMSGWSTVNAPRITLKPGETAKTLANRYGVPEKEILRANGGALAAGQSVVIPTFGPARNSAKTAAGDIDLQKNAPAPGNQSEQKLAVLPSRDKSFAEPGKLTPPGGKPLGGTYTVKPGDTLTKIARETGTSVDVLKAANGMTDGTVRIGQTLKVANAGAATDPVRTASVPQKPAEQMPAAPKAAAPQPAVAKVEPAVASPSKPAAAENASLSEVEKKSDMASVAPQSTGIDKYRWPVNGAVIAGYGSNVNGSRNDGIDISVPEGTPIKAAENGVVIYAGNGLKQLGNTVLVRHDDGKVTVYGHASAINVTRGQKVTRGQTLAASGMSGDAQRPQVHFEVRKDATPVNPNTFLE